jgi:hypothetical protein
MAADAEHPKPEKSERGGAEIPIHPLVTRLLGESGEPQDLVTLVGYIGPSKKAGHVRLYTGLDFQTYYEIPREGVALAEAVDREDENSPTRLMIQADATVDLVQTSKQSGPASYLAGAIAGTYLAGAAAAQITAVHPIPTKYTICRCLITVPTQCVCTFPPFCPGIPGGQVGEEAAAAYQYRSVNYTCPCFATRWPLCPLPEAQVGPAVGAAPPPTSPVICRFTTPIACVWTHVWQCHITVVCTVPPQCIRYTVPPYCPIHTAVACTIPPQCIRYTVPPYCPIHTAVGCPPITLACPEGPGGGPVEVQAQAGMYAYPASVYCRTPYFPCVTQPHCGTPHCPMAPVATPQAVAPQMPLHPSLHCHTVRDDCTMVAPCTLHHGCPTNYHQLC